MKLKLMVALILVFIGFGLLWAGDKQSSAGKTRGDKNTPVQNILLDGFEKNDWETHSGEGGNVKTNLTDGKTGKALRMDYDLTPKGSWVLISKKISPGLEQRAIRFFYKGSGNKINNLEIKLLDTDGSIFGFKVNVEPADTWEQLTLTRTDFSHWWGGDNKLDIITQVEFAVSSGEGGMGSIALDDLMLVASELKKARTIRSGFIDDCDSLKGWNREKEEGASITLVTRPGKVGKALVARYDLAGKNWVQFFKTVPMEVSKHSVIKLFLMMIGEQNSIEIKLIDRDGSTFGKKFENLPPDSEWKDLRIIVSQLEYWWGGDKELDMNNITGLWIGISRNKGGKGMVAVDQIELFPE